LLLKSGATASRVVRHSHVARCGDLHVMEMRSLPDLRGH